MFTNCEEFSSCFQFVPKKFEIKRRENRCLLTVRFATPEDAGIYQCKCEGDQTQTELSVIGKCDVIEIE